MTLGVECGQLAPNVHGVRVGSDLVLLDLAVDDYLLLPDCGALTVEGSELRGPVETLVRLASDELLRSGSPASPRKGPPPLPAKALPQTAGASPNLGDALTFAALWLDAASRRPTLQQLAERVRSRAGDREDLEAIAERVEVFRQLLPLAPWTGACLLQTELLLGFLNAAGFDADWVFGVRVWPFLAHCWLQIGDVCVSQSPETLTIYRPILAV